MRIDELLATNARVKPLYSFEFFPPKDDAGQTQLWQTLTSLAELTPDFVSVTYGANGSQRDRTIDVTKRLAHETSMRTMGHLTCVDQSVRQVIDVIDQYAANGLEHVFAVRGDMPGGPSIAWQAHPNGLKNATQLVELVRARGSFCIGVAAFPDPHPSKCNPDLDARILKDKWEAGADFAITQLFFQAKSYCQMVDRVRSIDCPIPIIPGIMPITMVSQIVKFSSMSGATIPPDMLRQLDAVGDDPAAVRTIGTSIAADLAQELLDQGAPGLHFFTQNRSLATRTIWQRLNLG